MEINQGIADISDLGTVTSVSVVSANGLAGSVATPTTTPAITLSTTITGLLKGNGTAISAASAGTDYEVPLTFSAPLVRTVNTISIPASTDAVNGYLTAVDHTTFNAKESALTFSTGLTRAVNTITSNISTGVAGGQTILGGTAANDDLTIEGTSNGTKTTSYVNLQTTGGYVGIGNTAPAAKLHVTANADTDIGIIVKGNSGTQSGNLQEWRNSGNGLLGSVANTGHVSFNKAAVSTDAIINLSGGNNERVDTTATAYGINLNVINASSGNIQGIAFISETRYNGTTGAVTGLFGNVRMNNAGNTLTAGRAFWAASPSILAGVELVTASGLYIEAQKVSKVTNAYAINAVGTSDMSYFAGTVGIGNTVPTARLHLPAGTTAASTAPIKFVSGTSLTTPEAGAHEYDGGSLFITPSSLIREALVGCIFTQTADKTVTNTVTETSIIGTGVGYGLTLPTNFWLAGKTIRLRIGGIYSTPALATPSIVLKVKYGSVVIATVTTSALLSGATNLEFDGEVDITCRTTGATGTVVVHGDVEYATGVAGTIAVDPLNNAGATTTINTTTSNLLDVTVTWDSATATRSATSTITTVEVLN